MKKSELESLIREALEEGWFDQMKAQAKTFGAKDKGKALANQRMKVLKKKAKEILDYLLDTEELMGSRKFQPGTFSNRGAEMEEIKPIEQAAQNLIANIDDYTSGRPVGSSVTEPAAPDYSDQDGNLAKLKQKMAQDKRATAPTQAAPSVSRADKMKTQMGMPPVQATAPSAAQGKHASRQKDIEKMKKWANNQKQKRGGAKDALDKFIQKRKDADNALPPYQGDYEAPKSEPKKKVTEPEPVTTPAPNPIARPKAKPAVRPQARPKAAPKPQAAPAPAPQPEPTPEPEPQVAPEPKQDKPVQAKFTDAQKRAVKGLEGFDVSRGKVVVSDPKKAFKSIIDKYSSTGQGKRSLQAALNKLSKTYGIDSFNLANVAKKEEPKSEPKPTVQPKAEPKSEPKATPKASKPTEEPKGDGFGLPAGRWKRHKQLQREPQSEPTLSPAEKAAMAAEKEKWQKMAGVSSNDSEEEKSPVLDKAKEILSKHDSWLKSKKDLKAMLDGTGMSVNDLKRQLDQERRKEDPDGSYKDYLKGGSKKFTPKATANNQDDEPEKKQSKKDSKEAEKKINKSIAALTKDEPDDGIDDFYDIEDLEDDTPEEEPKKKEPEKKSKSKAKPQAFKKRRRKVTEKQLKEILRVLKSKRR